MTRKASFRQLVDEGVLEIGDGYRAKNAELGGNGPIFLRSAYLQDNGFVEHMPERFIAQDARSFGAKVAQLGDVVITTKGNSTGRVGVIRAPQVGAIYSPHLSYWRSRNASSLDQGFLQAWSSSPEFKAQLAGKAYSTDMAPYLSLRDQMSLSISLPPLPEQRAIAATLGALDDKVELNRKMNATLEAMARALFRDWFVDFGPTRARMEGLAPYLSPDLWALFPDRLDDEGKPEGWEVSTIGEVIQLLDRKRVPLSSQERAKRQGPYPYHGATSVMDYIDDYLFDEKLLLLGEDGSVAQADGRPFTQYVWGKLWVNNHAHVIKGREISVEQLKLFFDRVDIRPFVTGAVQPKLNQANLRRVPFLCAKGEVQSAFDAAIAPLFDLIRHNHEESRTLAQTRDLLLPRLMSGELRVAEAEHITQEVA